MNLVRRQTSMSPSRDDFFFPIQQHFDKFFESFFEDTNVDKVISTGGYPKMDVLTENHQWVIKAAIPGVSPDDISVDYSPSHATTNEFGVSVTNPPILSISGKMSKEHQSPENADYYVRELKKSSFQRTLTLPKWIEGDPKVTFKDGMLKMAWCLPEKDAEITPEIKRIEIKRTD